LIEGHAKREKFKSYKENAALSDGAKNDLGENVRWDKSKLL
jgi:hypothetical protein